MLWILLRRLPISQPEGTCSERTMLRKLQSRPPATALQLSSCHFPSLILCAATMVIFRPLTIPCSFLPQGVSIIWNIFFCTLSILIPTWNEISHPSPGLISYVRSTHAAAYTSPNSFSHNFNSITVSFPIPSPESKFY